MSSTSSSEFDRVIGRLRETKETDIHKDVVVPLLTRMGMQCVRYVHGSFERGKDIIYLERDAFDDDRLVVCQVKNEEFSGNATSSNATSTVLTQVRQCRVTTVLHPTTHLMEKPQAVVLITTHPIPDRTTAGMDSFLAELHASECKILSPERFVGLIKRHLPEVYEQLAFPGEGGARALRVYVSAHRESGAFEVARERELDTFFINLGVAHSGNFLPQIERGALRIREATSVNVQQVTYHFLTGLYRNLAGHLGGFDPFVREESLTYDTSEPSRHFGERESDDADGESEEGHLSVLPVRETDVRLRKVRFPKLMQCVAGHLARTRAAIQKAADPVSKAPLTASAIEFLSVCDYFIESLVGALGDDVAPASKEAVRTPFKFHFPEAVPSALLGLPANVCLMADGGSGKTSVARKLARDALDSGTKCVFFPCARIRQPDTSLEDAISAFLHSLTPAQPDGSVDALDGVRLIILDGCDEAATFAGRLAADIEQLAFLGPVSYQVAAPGPTEPVIPDGLSEAVVYDRRRGTLTFQRLVGWIDYQRLLAHNHDDPFRTAIVELFSQCTRQNPKLIITTRAPLGRSLTAKFIGIRLMPFSDDQVNQFFTRWFDGQKGAAAIIDHLGGNPRIREVCRIPLVATILAALYESERDLPRSMTGLYKERFGLLLDGWDRARGVPQRNVVRAEDKLFFLQRLALRLHQEHRREFTSLDATKLWQESFRDLHSLLSLEDFLEELRVCNSLIVSVGSDTYTLGHLSFQEYLAALGVISGQRSGNLLTWYFDPWWSNVLIFYAGLAGDISPLLERMQNRAGLANAGGLLGEMLKEARFTTSAALDAVNAFEDDDLGFLDDDKESGEDERDLEMTDRGEEDLLEDGEADPDDVW